MFFDMSEKFVFYYCFSKLLVNFDHEHGVQGEFKGISSIYIKDKIC